MLGRKCFDPSDSYDPCFGIARLQDVVSLKMPIFSLIDMRRVRRSGSPPAGRGSRKKGWRTCLLLVAFSQAAVAQIPVLGRYQDFAYSADAVQSQAELAYGELLTELRSKRRLDDEPDLNRRVQHIAAGLIAKAIEKKPAAATWHWEVHTTSEPNQAASCFAGGKLVFGTAYIRRLDLNDGELATLIAHEVAHAVAEHQREELSRVFYLNAGSLPLSVATAMVRIDSDFSLQIKVATLLKIQESEADELGMILAHNAGWPAASMINFYTKLAASDAPTLLSWTYPSAASRLNMAHILGIIFSRQ
jgi:predicted Zn-dependent protease